MATAFRTWALLALVCACVAKKVDGRQLLGASEKGYTVVIFGDSLSDNGNTFRAANVPDKDVYWQGRFSNGPIWVDYLSEYYANDSSVKIFTYATGSATACNSTYNEQNFPFVKDLTAQTVQFLTDVKAGKIPIGPGYKLVVINWIGSNDFLDIFKDGGALPPPQQVAAVVQNVVTCRMKAIGVLSAVLKMPMEVAVVPTAPMHMAPQIPDSAKPMIHALDLALSKATQMGIRSVCKTFHKAKPGEVGYGVKVHSLGLNSDWITQGIKLARPPFKHFGNESCFKNPNSSIVISGPLKMCDNPNDYAFFDTMHPTTNYQKWLGLDGLFKRLQAIGLLPK